ncbi:putative alpha amylase, catalytic subfamily protein [Monocercomonoides exilis]|uniref:putative alpha amylase, catalytic subfamily protein n=1 Tax=Monocercomonoides exilis TaxID=2049356 RepID=UPI00355965BD|nr:putative alpha amylase, catalytic subfamily protein [Monocercomonoides exilis]|eukprot:MONOS_4736.1-p1 / transcript=MONOS_4736.1 / gene=MONOS_4736 / organism=Monocercomonoides_exilis_PA203 / gene_product=alpha amylase, catalytic subfamily protein / transcript_product=alpha amylase, catalytic subfamily protein / location=Mono_scaffold00130:24516-26133(-) / protein_length=505 / sequence_SO=supercontig / SO=protein_coding / is_pseudo=false
MIAILLLISELYSVIQIPRYPSLLELSARPWLYELGKKYHKSITSLSMIPEAEFQAISQSGYNIVWLMGVWSLGPKGLQHDRTDSGLKRSYDRVLPGWTNDDVIGSPYAIKDYVINPQLGTPQDLTEFRNRLHKYGIQLYLDLVPNHSAVDMKNVDAHPEYYVRAPPSDRPPYDPNIYLSNGVAYGKDPYSGAWTDTAQYNMWEEKMRAQLITYLRVCSQYADGVRCDMAMLLLNDVIEQTWGYQLHAWNYTQPSAQFWEQATKTLKRLVPGFSFMAEVYWGRENQLLGMGFDWMYDKDGLYNRLTDGNLDNLRGYIKGTDLSHMTHFTENHDEERAITNFGSVSRANAAAVVSMTLPGMRFYFQGQMEGKQNKLDVHLRRSKDEEVKQNVVNFYQKLQKSLNHTVFHSGDWQYVDPTDVDGSSWRFLSWKWKEGKEKRLCIINYSDGQAVARFKCPDVYEKAQGDDVKVVDELNGNTYSRSASEMKNEGLYVVLPAWGAHIFNY